MTVATRSVRRFDCMTCGSSFNTRGGLCNHRYYNHSDEWMTDPVPFGMHKGYEHWNGAFDGESETVGVHQLLACVDNDPHEVFAEDTNVHHGSDGNHRLPNTEIPWANWSGNVEVMEAGDHGRHHTKISNKDLLDEICRLNELGYEPTMDEMNDHGEYSHGPYYDRFDSWTAAKEQALNDGHTHDKGVLADWS